MGLSAQPGAERGQRCSTRIQRAQFEEEARASAMRQKEGGACLSYELEAGLVASSLV